MDGRAVRQIILGFVAFTSVLALLFGIGSVVGPDPTRSGEPPGSGVVGVSSPSGAVGSASPSAEPAATPSPSGDPVLIGAGDIADCGLDADEATARLVAAVEGTVFTAGDDAYPSGSESDFRDCYDPTWGRFLDRTRPAPGNHDHLTRDLAGYRAYFGSAATPDGTVWYSYDLAAWHVIVLDSSCELVGGCGEDSEQGRWLADDLAASTAHCTIAIWHHPRWSSGQHGSDPVVTPFWRALYEAGADIVINGHDHDYERFRPQDPAGRLDPDRGIREFVVGTGGADTRPFSTIAANSALRATGIHGVIRFVLGSTAYDWEFLSTTGELTDSGHGTCHS
jgi:Calcineurin-like phosphoesterase